MPLTHDLEEAKIQNELLAVALLKNPVAILGQEKERLGQVVKILGEVCQKKQSEEHTLQKFSVAIANMSQDPAIQASFAQMSSQLDEEQKGRITEVYNRCNEEVRANVMHAISQ